MRGCAGARVRGCAGARVRGCKLLPVPHPAAGLDGRTHTQTSTHRCAHGQGGQQPVATNPASSTLTSHPTHPTHPRLRSRRHHRLQQCQTSQPPHPTPPRTHLLKGFEEERVLGVIKWSEQRPIVHGYVHRTSMGLAPLPPGSYKDQNIHTVTSPTVRACTCFVAAPARS